MVLRTGAFVLSLLLGVVFLLPSLSHAQAFRCPDGTMSHPATEAEAVYAAGGDITVGVTQVCSVVQAGITEDVGRAKQTLDSMWCNGRAPRCGSHTTTIEKLDPKFAVCAARFLQQVRTQDPSICILSAYRSPEHQAAICSQQCGAIAGPCAAPGQSKHQSGRALDISKPGYNILPAWIHQAARQSGNISFPVRNDSGHMEPANIDASGCSTAGYIAPGNGGSSLISSSNSPFRSGLQSLGFAQPQQPFFPPQPQLPPQPLPQQQPLMNSFAPQPLPQPTIAPTTQTQTQTSSNTNTNTSSSTNVDLTIAERLRQLMDGTPTPTPGSSATTVPIIITGASAGTIASSGGNQPEQQSTTSTGSLQPVGQQTFTSQDLRWEPQQPTASSFDGSTYSRLVQLYTSLRDTLAKILEYLRPFGGGRAPVVHE